jgi:FkbM family methyltransferase
MDILNVVQKSIDDSSRPIIIELGGCDGYHSKIISKKLIDCQKEFLYIILEPVENLFQKIKDELKDIKNVFVLNKAIGSQNGVVEFYKSDSKYFGSSSIRKPKRAYEFWQDMTFSEMTCECITLDQLVCDFEIQNEKIDFIWADVQGAEKDLIKGGKKALAKTRFFYTEFMEYEVYEGQEHNYQNLLKSLPNFSVEHKYDYDVLFKNKKNV